jgi:hypothetical protein
MTRRHWYALLGGLLLGSAALVPIGIVSNWSLGDSLGVAGLALSIAGFFVAIVEIRRAQAVSKATETAVLKTLKSVAAGRLFVAITQLRQFVVDLEDASANSEGRRARDALNRWRQVGGDAEGLIRRRFGADHPSLSPLHRSIELAADAKEALFEEGETVSDATAECRDAMSKTEDLLGPLLEELHPTIEEIQQ